jgi:hypothetical protein
VASYTAACFGWFALTLLFWRLHICPSRNTNSGHIRSITG